MAEPRILQASIKDVDFGKNVTLVQPLNLYGCSISDNTFVGPFVEIQSGVSIGINCRIQSHSFICSLVTMGADVFVGHGVMFINDLFTDGDRARGDMDKFKETIIGDHVNIGSNCTILPVKITSGVCVGAGSVVTKDLLVKGIYAGNPARLIRKLP